MIRAASGRLGSILVATIAIAAAAIMAIGLSLNVNLMAHDHRDPISL
jgi:hypothetical protein